MRIGVMILSALSGVVVVGGVAAELALVHTNSSFGLTLLLFGAVTYVLAAVVGAALVANWPLDRVTAEAKRPIAITVTVVGVLGVLGLVAVVVGGVVAGLPVWVTVLNVVVQLALAAAQLGLARSALRRSRLHPDVPGPIPADMARRWRRRVILGAAIGFFVVLAAIAAVSIPTGLLERKPAETLPFFLEPVAFAFIVAGCVSNFTVLGPLRSAGAELGGDYAVRRRVVRAVRRGRGELDSADTVRAARYARALAPVMPMQQFGSLAVLVGVLANLFAVMSNDRDSTLLLVAGACIVMAIAFTPLALAQIRRVRRYAAAHPVEAAG